MSLDDYKIVFVSVGLIGILLLGTPALGLVVHLPGGEQFSELYVLGPGHMAEDYPFNVTAGVNYTVYVGVTDHLGSAAYYKVMVKFRNQTEPLPNSTSATPSTLPSLYNYSMFLLDNETREVPLTFSFTDVSRSDNRTTVGNIVINSVPLSVDKLALRDSVNNGTFYQVFMELWLYDAQYDVFNYNNRFISEWLNMTVPA